MQNAEVNCWSRQSGYIWSLMGSAVGFANVIAFSAQCYRNGGGAFLLPFFVAMCVLGLPMLYLEALIGHRWKKALVSSYGKVSGNGPKTLGWLAVIACLTIGGFYVVLTGYSLAYLFFSGGGCIASDTETFFQQDFLHLTESLNTLGGISWVPFLAALVVLCVTAYVLFRGIREGIERTCSLFLPILVVLMLSMAIGSAFLPGAMDGWMHFLKPDFSRLSDVGLWRDVFGHLFFSFSLGLGIVVGYSRYTDQHVDLVKAMRWVAFGDFAISFIAGLAIFGGIGYMSQSSGVPFEEIVSSDSIFQIGFVVFPKLIQLFGPVFSRIVGVLFFFSVFVAGITGVFSIVESVVGNLECEFGWRRRDSVTITLLAIGGLSLLFCMGAGLHLVDAIVPMVMGVNMLIGGIAQILIFAWKSKEIRMAPLWNRDWQTRAGFWFLSVVVPAILFVILIGCVYADFQAADQAVLIRWGWLMFAFLIGWCCVKRRCKNEINSVIDLA
ncbi:MAG: sodium-dependent transporter [Waddliaceae bacterium]